MSEAMVDDVTITLITWSHDAKTGRFEAQVALTNHSNGPVRIGADVRLISRNVGCGSSNEILDASPGSEYIVKPAEKMIYSLRGETADRATPAYLIVGLLETDRSGARVEFPLNGDGASAFGGSGAPGGNAGEGTAAAGTAIASPAGATPASNP